MDPSELLKQLSDFYDQYKPSLKETHNGVVPQKVMDGAQEFLKQIQQAVPAFSVSLPTRSHWSDLLKALENSLEQLYKSR